MLNTEEFKTGTLKVRKQLIGNVTYEYVEKAAGTERAPKITGMIIDMPEFVLYRYILTYG